LLFKSKESEKPGLNQDLVEKLLSLVDKQYDLGTLRHLFQRQTKNVGTPRFKLMYLIAILLAYVTSFTDFSFV